MVVGSHPDRTQITAYIDGELPRQEQADLLHHLRGCKRCRQMVESQVQAASLMSATVDTSGELESDENVQAILQRLQQEMKPKRATVEPRRLSVSLITGLMFTLIFFYGTQALVASLAAKAGEHMKMPEVTTYVEEHVSFEGFFKTMAYE